MDRVAIVIPVHNGERYIKEAIDSCLNQTYNDVEVIVVDDGSTDTTPEILGSYGRTIKTLRIPHPDRNVGRVFNSGIRLMEASWFKEMEADDRLFPWACEALISAAKDDKNKADTIYYADVDWINEDGKFFFGLKEANRNNMDPFDFNTSLLIHNIGNGISVLIHKSALEKHGLFPEDTKHEDYKMRLDWCLLQGCQMKFIDRIVAEYRVHKQSYTAKRTLDDLIDEDIRIKRQIIDQMDEPTQRKYALAIAKRMFDPRQHPDYFTEPSLARLIHLKSFNNIVYNKR